MGPEINVLADPSPQHCQRLWLDHPCLLPAEMAALSLLKDLKGWQLRTIDATWPMSEGAAGLERHLQRLSDEAVWAAKHPSCLYQHKNYIETYTITYIHNISIISI